MTTWSRRDMMIGGALMGGAGLSALAAPPPAPPRITQATFEQAIPDVIGGWRSVVLPGVVLPPRDELSTAIYDGYIARAYAMAGQAPVFLVIAYGSAQDYALQLHRPETCYPASGYAISSRQATLLKLGERQIPATQMTASRRGREDRVLYWTRTGSRYAEGAWDARLAILRDALNGIVSSGVLLRFSTASEDGDARLRAFAQSFVASLGKNGQALIFEDIGQTRGRAG